MVGLTGAATRGASAQQDPPGEAAQVAGAWEISNADRDRKCAVTFSADDAAGGQKVEFDPGCFTVFPSLSNVAAWTIDGSVLRLVDRNRTVLMEFTEVENGLFESDRRADGLLFLQTQAALKIETRTVEQIVGDWYFIREADKPLCRITLTGDAQGEGFRLVVKAGCGAPVAGFAPALWRVDGDQLVLAGKSGSWRFSEADPTTWERVPLSADPLLLVRQK